MLNRTIKATALALLCAMPLGALAVPAKPGLIPMKQADGSVIEIRLVGDERSHYTLSEDGYLITPVNDTFYYATISEDGLVVATDMKASAANKRSADEKAFLSTIDLSAQGAKMMARDAVMKQTSKMASPANFIRAPRPQAIPSSGDELFEQGPGLFPGSFFPAYGEQKGLVLLVQYKDEKFHLTDPLDYFSRMLNEPGFNDYNATGSAVDFYRESSGDRFRPQFDVFGPVTLSRDMSYYGGNAIMGGDLHAEDMIIEACQLLDDTVDFTQYDRDGDGVIDNVFVIYAGYGEASSGISNTIWPHSWEITSATSTPYIFDGVQLDRYACSNEWLDGRPDGVGTFVHEFSHVMGLPDLYATSYTGAFTPGNWSAMDTGPYNNNGMTPPLFSAYERYALGWIEPTEITGPLNVELSSIGSNVCGIVKTADPNEYFLFENRQNTSWDTYIPGHGMLIWHVQYDPEVWSANVVNNTPAHQYVDLIEADGTQSDLSRKSDSFPGTVDITSFTATTTPSFTLWSGEPVNLPITNISETADGKIRFVVAGGNSEELRVPYATEATDVTATSFVAHWDAAQDAEGYLLTFRKLSDEGAPVAVFTRRNMGTETSYTVEGLEPDAKYEYEVVGGNPLQFSTPSNVIEVTTGHATLDMLTPGVLEASDVTENSFTANWEAVEGATDYILTVMEKDQPELNETVCDFTDGVTALPAGWGSNVKTDYTIAAYCGQAVPAMRMSKSGDIISTGLFPEPIHKISFWQRGAVASDPEDVINVYVKVGLSWRFLTSFAVETKAGGKTCIIDQLPTGTSQARFEYVRKSMKGTLALDDISIFWGKEGKETAVEGFPVKTGNLLSHSVENLKPATTYIYNVVATDGTLNSLGSDFARVLTNESTSIADIAGDPAEHFTVDGLTIHALDTISVYDVTGHCVANLTDGASTTLATGVYLIKTSGQVFKTLLN